MAAKKDSKDKPELTYAYLRGLAYYLRLSLRDSFSHSVPDSTTISSILNDVQSIKEPNSSIALHVSRIVDKSVMLYGKSVYALLSQVSLIGKFGAQKYGDLNYTKGCNLRLLLDAVCRHLIKYRYSGPIDDESELPHLAHIVANCLIILDNLDRGTLIDEFGLLKENSL